VKDFYFKIVRKSVDFALHLYPEQNPLIDMERWEMTYTKKNVSQPQKNEPALWESYGSFPVWLLKLIQAVTPGFLISKSPSPKRKLPQ
jgi:hypothetical protein